MDSKFVQYELDDGIATIRIDDGKRNALAPRVLDEIYAAFDRAESDQAVVLLTGRDDVFSAGFDLKVMKKGGMNAVRMLRRGYALPARVMAYPYPVIAACNGHSLAMGVFLMLSADYIVGSRGDYRIAANEVAIGMTMPRVAATVLQHRLSPAAYQKGVTTAHMFDPDSALEAGFFDELVQPDALASRSRELAEAAKALDMAAHRASKRRIRKKTIRRLRRSVPLDMFDVLMIALSR